MDTPLAEPVVDRSPASAARLWGSWTLATALGYLVAIGLPVVLGAMGPTGGPSFSGVIAAVLLGGLVTGLPQYLVLKRRLLQPAAWLGATSLGWILAVVGGTLLGVFLGYVLDLQSDSATVLVASAMVGGLLGLIQWITLRGTVTHAGWWILGSALGWVLGFSALDGSQRLSAPLLEQSGHWELQTLLGLAIAGLVLGAVTGAVLVALLGWAPQQAQLVSSVDAAQPVTAGDMTVYRLPSAGFVKGPSPWIWAGLFVVVLFGFGGAVFWAAQAGPGASSWAATPTPVDVWRSVGDLQPQFETDYQKTRDTFYAGDYYALEYSALQQPPMTEPGTEHHMLRIYYSSRTLLLGTTLCARSKQTLYQNLEHYDFSVEVNGREVPKTELHTIPFDLEAGTIPEYSQAMACVRYGILASQWPAGDNRIVESWSFDQEVNNGLRSYKPGQYVIDYSLRVGP